MAEIHVSEERSISAPAATVYGLIADYRRHHPKFLPANFSKYEVQEGGVGAGTVVQFRLKAGGRDRMYRVQITEPEPGRVLQEADTLSTAVTTFTVIPEDGTSRVRIDTTWQGAGGVGGFFERTFAPRVLRSLYADELERLDTYARSQSSQST